MVYQQALSPLALAEIFIPRAEELVVTRANSLADRIAAIRDKAAELESIAVALEKQLDQFAASIETTSAVGDPPAQMKGSLPACTCNAPLNGWFVFGGPGDELLFGSAANDWMFGFTGNDFMFGFNGNDRIYGGQGNDILVGGRGDDCLYGDDGLDWLHGQAGNDLLQGHLGNDFEFGGPGDDCMYGDAPALPFLGGTDFMFGGDGTDDMEGNHLTDFMFGQALSDNINGDWGNGPQLSFGDDWIFGGGGDDFMWGRFRNDWIFGDEGKDSVEGDLGNDVIDGGPDNDTLYGNVGSDIIRGGTGKDLIEGGDHSDVLMGQDGDDIIFGGTFLDVISGGKGSDEIHGGIWNDLISGNDDDDRIWGDEGLDIIFGASGDDCIDGGSENDLLVGGDGDDNILGRDGWDVLLGGSGGDILDGGPGNDFMHGGPGSDDCYGGGGVNVSLSCTPHSGSSGLDCPGDPIGGGGTNPAIYAICGVKWCDGNRNGIRDIGETTLLPGVTIYLDLNCNGMLDIGEPTAVTALDDPSTTQNETGTYCFQLLTNGTYCVCEVVPVPMIQTFPVSGACHVVAIGSALPVANCDFGNACTNTPVNPVNHIPPQGCGIGGGPPPVLLFASGSGNTVTLTFDTLPDPGCVLNLAHYAVTPGGFTVTGVSFGANGQTLKRTVTPALNVGVSYHVTVNPVCDMCGDSGTASHDFLATILAPVVAISPNGTAIVIHADQPGTLQHARSVEGPWRDIPFSNNGVRIQPTNSAGFYRLRQ